MTNEKQNREKPEEEKKKIKAKPLPVDKEKAREIEVQMKKPEETDKTEDKETTKEEKKKEEKPKIKKAEAIAHGAAFPISKKHSMYICRFIKNKDIDRAISELYQVTRLRLAVPFKGEIPHRKGKGVMSARYPVNAAKQFINLLKGLKGNAIVNGLELENTRIYLASASWARRPARAGGRAAKRTNIILKAKEITEKINNKNKEKK